MLKSSAVYTEVFKERCNYLIEDFRKFLATDCGVLFSKGEEVNLELILEINRRSSTQRGVFGPSLHKGTSNAHAVIFWEGQKIIPCSSSVELLLTTRTFQ